MYLEFALDLYHLSDPAALVNRTSFQLVASLNMESEHFYRLPYNTSATQWGQYSGHSSQSCMIAMLPTIVSLNGERRKVVTNGQADSINKKNEVVSRWNGSFDNTATSRAHCSWPNRFLHQPRAGDEVCTANLETNDNVHAVKCHW